MQNTTGLIQILLKIKGSPFYQQNFPDPDFTTALLSLAYS